MWAAQENEGRHCLGILLSYYPCWFLECRVLIQLKLPKLALGLSVILLSSGGKSLYHQYITTLPVTQSICLSLAYKLCHYWGQCALAGAFASYYWALKTDDIPPYPLTAFDYLQGKFHIEHYIYLPSYDLVCL